MQIALKVDIDTRKGLISGCPNILRILRGAGISASFFIPMGPDRTGMTITRVFKNLRILQKAKRTNIFEIYGFPTLLYGILLPSPGIITGNENTLLRMREEGHEVGMHGYDHFKWQDFIDRMDKRAIEKELERAFFVYRRIFKSEPKSFAAPGWRCSRAAWSVIDSRGFLYTSNTRGNSIYFPGFSGSGLSVPEIPTTLPTLDEMRIPKTEETISEAVNTLMKCLDEKGLNVFTLHAEIEGVVCLDFLKRFIEILKAKNAEFTRLEDIARHAIANKGSIKKSGVTYRTIEGRSTSVACQKQ